MMMENHEFLAQLKRVQLHLKPALRAKTVGIHTLSHRGRSLEFASYREYRPGDDIKELDWKIFARSDRYYIKQRDRQSPATALILIDNSASMNWKSAQAEMSKLFAALLLAFAFGYVLYQQGDAFSLYPMHHSPDPLSPRSSRKALNHLIYQLRQIQQSEGQVSPPLFKMEWNRPAVDHLFVISDFLVPESTWKNWIPPMLSTARKISFFRVLDEAEIHPDARQSHLQSVEDLHQKRQVTSKDWEWYSAEFQKHSQNLVQACQRYGIVLHQFTTQPSIHSSIHKILSSLR